MKTFRKALSIILGLAMILSCVAGMQISASAEGNLTLSVGEATIKDDGTVTVPVVVDENTGFQALTATVDYDNTVLTLVDAGKADFVDAEDSAVFGPSDAEKFKMQWAFALSADVTATGTIATLTFKVVDGVEVDATDIDLEVTEAWDAAGNAVTATANDGTVEFVKEPVHTHNYTYEFDAKGHSKVCANEDGLCDVVTTEKVAHIFDEATGLCECGLKLDSRLEATKISFSFSDSALVCNYRFANTGLLDLYEDVAFAITPNKYDKTTLNLVKNPTTTLIHESEYTKAGTKFMEYKYSDFYLYELALSVEFMFEAYEDGKLVAVSPMYSKSAAEEIKATVIESTDPAAKKAYTDLLIVCDEYMKVTGANYVGSDLYNAPSILEGFDTSARTLSVEEWDITDNFVSYNDNFKMGDSSAAHEVRVSVETAKVPFFNLRIMDKKSNLDISKLAVTVSYTSVDTAGSHPKTYTFDKPEDFTDAARYDELKFDLVGLHDSNKVIKFEVTYDGAPIFDYYRSVESYTGANQNATDGTAEAMKSLLHFGQSFRAYMGI